MRGKEGSIIVTIAITVFLVLALLSPVCHSANQEEVEITSTAVGWSDEVNLSNNNKEETDQKIAVNGDIVHIVWERDTNLCYIRSDDGGQTWNDIVIIYQSAVYLDDPDISVSGQNVHVVIEDLDGWRGIYYLNSTDGGDTWNPARRISPNGIEAGNPHVYANNSNIHITWHDFRTGVNGEIFYRRSLDGGITFDNGQGVDEDRQITFTPDYISGIKMAGYGSNISVAWADERDGDWDVYWMISKDNGYTWEDGLGTQHVGREIAETPVDSTERRLCVFESNIHIVWVDVIWPGPDYYINYRNSTDNGATWNTIQLVVANPMSHAPYITANENMVHLVWHDWRDDGVNTEVYYQNSTDGGATWGSELRVTYNVGFHCYEPKIEVNNETLHVVWYDFRDGNRETYYTRSPDFPPDPTYNISLDEGWNLISLPHEQRDESIIEVLSSINGKWDYIQAYDPLAPKPWKTYATFKPNQLNELQSLNHRMGFWINITESNVNLTVSGPIPASTSINLYAGWNLVGYLSLVNETVANALWGTGADKVEVFDPAEPYRIKEVGPSYVMKPGEGYWIHVPMDTTWIINW